MLILILSILCLGLVVAACQLLSHHRGIEEPPIHVSQTCATCNGTPQTKCEQECMMEASTKPIEYFDDEELDAYRGMSSDAYTDADVERFSEVLYTMRSDEVAAWCRSLNLRHVSLPDQLKDEVVMLINESEMQ